MTLDDLIAIYLTEIIAAVESGADDEDARRKGMIAVLMGVRDYIEDAYEDAGNSWEGDLALKVFNEILAIGQDKQEGDVHDRRISEGIPGTGPGGGATAGHPEGSGLGTAHNDQLDQEIPRAISGSDEAGRGCDVGSQRYNRVGDGKAADGSGQDASAAEPRECVWRPSTGYWRGWFRTSHGEYYSSDPGVEVGAGGICVCGGKIKIKIEEATP